MTTDEILAKIRQRADDSFRCWEESSALAEEAETDDVEGFDELRDEAITADGDVITLFRELDARLSAGAEPPASWQRP